MPVTACPHHLFTRRSGSCPWCSGQSKGGFTSWRRVATPASRSGRTTSRRSDAR